MRLITIIHMDNKMTGIGEAGESASKLDKIRTWGNGKMKALALATLLSFGANQVLAGEEGNVPTEDEFEQFIVDYQAEHGKNPSDEMMMAFLAGEIERLEQESYEMAKEFGDTLIAQHQAELEAQAEQQ